MTGSRTNLWTIRFLGLMLSNFFLLGNTAYAQYADTLQFNQQASFWKSNFVKKATVPTLLFGATALTWSQRENIRTARNRYIPEFRYSYDDYLQYAPAIAVVGLNALNVKGKHTPVRTFVAYAFSIGIMGSFVNGIKYTTKVQRPNGTSRNSFPSGHTATSFMNATVLHKEYGQYRHQLYSVGGYAMATATAMGRGLNNKHWITDVLAGAGIGIVSTELGYLITDQLFKNRSINAPLRNNPVPIGNNPSFIALQLGYALNTNRSMAPMAEDLYTTRGSNMGFEGAWFLNKHFGFGGEFAFTSFPVNSDNVVLHTKALAISTDLHSEAMGIRHINIGPYFSLPLPNNWFITGKINLGLSSATTGNTMLKLNKESEIKFATQEIPYIRYTPSASGSYSIGAGIQKRVGRNTAIKAYTTYFDSSHEFKITALSSFDDKGNFLYTDLPLDRLKLKFNHFTFGLGLTTFIW